MRRPGDPEPESPGGHAADRLREFLAERFGRRPGAPPEADVEGEEAVPEDEAALLPDEVSEEDEALFEEDEASVEENERPPDAAATEP